VAAGAVMTAPSATTRLVAASLACAVVFLWAAGAGAQYPYDDAPRPPGAVPGRGQPQYPPPQYQQQYPPQYQQQQYPPPQQYQQQYPSSQYQQQYQQQQYQPPARAAPIQSEDLPAPGSVPARPATAMNPPGQPPQTQSPQAPNPQMQPPLPGPPGQPPPQQGRPQTRPPAAAADVVTAPPPQRIANGTAVFSGLDKITGRLTSFESAIGETVQFGALRVTARACYSRPPTETPLTDGFVEVDEVALQGDVRRIFTGWMFAASPGLHAVEHAVYDVWLVDCKGGGVQAAAAESPAGASPRQPRQGGSGQQQRAPQQRQPAAPPSPR